MSLKHTPLLLLIAASMTAFTGCGNSADTTQSSVVASSSEAAETVYIGKRLTVNNTDERLTFRDYNESLSLQGLYYATWSIGEAQEYVNSEEETVDLYDAQLYLILGETDSEDSASESFESWLSAAKENYEITNEEEVEIGEVTYTILEYDCVSETSPYTHGVSAFCLKEDCAVCAELQSQETYGEDLRSILESFLESCELN